MNSQELSNGEENIIDALYAINATLTTINNNLERLVKVIAE